MLHPTPLSSVPRTQFHFPDIPHLSGANRRKHVSHPTLPS